MRRFTQDATRLAFARQRVVTGRDSIGGRRDEADLLQAVAADRALLLASGPQAPASTAPQHYPQPADPTQPFDQYGAPRQSQQGPPVI
ncbi:hypothetical protein SAMN06295879_0842 [Agreia bicolorata]|uniref:Uncharacterized protein n=1 Tax=Agreia bicolorata TaxID=110935 RepID=A0A1T4X8U5_9MICO|nr:hypothetical protein [Agreia bicolorata]SKA85869.1 hypothetical protein SAMN06295879_0842 [Agreia bicolorata]